MNDPRGAKLWARERATEVMDQIKAIKEEEGGVLERVPGVREGDQYGDYGYWLNQDKGADHG